MSHRLLSNVVVLLVIGVGFAGVTFAINWFADSGIRRDHEFSFERRTADRFLAEGNLSAAARYYQQLSLSDPGNGGAKARYALCLAEQQQPFLDQIYGQLRTDNPDTTVIEQATAEANKFAAEAIEAYELVLDFPPLRDDARFRLARLHALAGDNEIAIEYLLLAGKDRRSIAGCIEFWTLRNEPEFRKLIRPGRR